MIRILIADQDQAARKALILLLQRKLGTCTLVEIPDVETLIRSLADSSPDLLLLDWKLYGSPAPETCRLLQKAYPTLKVMLMSVDPNDAVAAKEAGAGFIYKGALPDEVIQKLMLLLNQTPTAVK